MDSQYQIDIISAMAERTIKRLWILIIILVVLLFGSNVAWIVYESSFQDIVVTQENGDAPNNYIGNDGDIHNYPEMKAADGKADSKNPQEEVREGDRVQEMP